MVCDNFCIMSLHCFEKYEQILENIRKHGKNKLILLMRCYREGYQVFDIGNSNSEYE